MAFPEAKISHVLLKNKPYEAFFIQEFKMNSASSVQKHIPSTLLKRQSPPRTCAQLNESMDAMDKQNSTSFKDWGIHFNNLIYL
jgi:hypothetical protein